LSTEPEPEGDDQTGGGDPAGAVRALAGRLEQVESLIRTLAWGVGRETDDLQAALDILTARLDQLEPPAPEAVVTGEDERTPEPQAWVDYATAKDWQDLAGWVDWLMATYDVIPSRAVLPCWPAHRGVAEELAALRTAWRAAALAGRASTPSDALIFWHDRWLHPCLLRLREAFQQMTCQDKHNQIRPGLRTDRELLTTTLVDAAERSAAAVLLPEDPPADQSTGELR